MKVIKPIFLWPTFFFMLPIIVCGLMLTSFIVGLAPKKDKSDSRFVFGNIAIPNNVFWSKALVAAGYKAECFTSTYNTVISRREVWGKVLSEKYRLCPVWLKPFLAFAHSLFLYDIFVISFQGYFIGRYPVLRRMQALFFRLARKKVVVIPYGADAFVYKRIKSTALQHALLLSYPDAAREQAKIAEQVDYWCMHADCIPTLIDGVGRWDVWVHSTLAIDLEAWPRKQKLNESNGHSGQRITIGHAPNHRGFKGTEFVIDAVQRLQDQGYNVDLVLMENLQNDDVKACLRNKIDILVEQLVYPGYTLNGIEGMATGIPVVNNLEDQDYLTPLRRWSYMDECPVVSSTPEDLAETLSMLIETPKLRAELSDAGRKFVEKYHGLDSAIYFFENIIQYVYGERETLLNLYHPILGEYPNRSPKIQHPLVNSRIVEK